MTDVKDQFEARMHDLGEFIREQRRVARLSLRKLSDMAGISNPYLSQIERGLRKPSAEILRDPSITEPQKQALIQVYQSFQHDNDDDSVGANHAAPATVSGADG